MRAHEEKYIDHEVGQTVMPEIKKLIPGIIGFLLRTIFPKIEKKLIEEIKKIVQMILDWQALQKD